MSRTRRLTPVRAHAEGLNAEQADQVDDWTGRTARAVMAGAAHLPELAADDEDRDGFDPETMTGEVEAYPAVMGRPYRMGFFTWHELAPGAFDASIDEQGGRMPLYIQHSWDWSERPPLGHAREAAEVDFDDTRAIRIAGRLYPDVPDGLATLHAMAAEALREWSIGYLIEQFSVEEDDENGRTVIHVERAQLWEASVVLRGANPWTRTESVASAGDQRVARAARMLDVPRDDLEGALAALQEPEPAPQPPPDPQVVAELAEFELRAAVPEFSRAQRPAQQRS